ncbi:GNAT family N-acetyltransferase [Cohnella panacarvi]|uniref:GNAT family N-acetyltransferase n=1 Tax=Cohnella panacarvi TaxID=400776 RepID=UPI0004789878|nr:GNAT family N-acetyltransferase [Cohnella panacarvi]
MQRPTTVRTMLFLAYFKIIITLLVVPSLFNAKVPEDFTSEELQTIISIITLSLLITIAFVYFARKRRYMPALISALAAIPLALIMNYPHLIASAVILVLFLQRSARDYFKNSARPIAKSNEAGGGKTEAIEAEGETVHEGSDSAEEAPSRPAAAPKTKAKTDLEVSIRQAAPEDADTIHALMLMSFEEYRTSIPPSSALEETSESILEALQNGSESAAILYEDDVAVAMVRYKFEGDAVYFFRLSVIPSKRRRGYAKRLVKWIEHQGTSKGMNASRCKVRQTVQNNVRMYQDMGYEILDTELVVRSTGTVKALSMEKSLRPQ